MKRFLAIALVALTVVTVATAKPKKEKKGKGVMTYEQYVAAPIDSEVVIETYVQAKQSWWDNKGTFYTQDKTGGYFIYNMACSQEEYNKLVPGTKIKVTGFKAEWSGEVEIIDAKYEILKSKKFIAAPVNATYDLGKDTLINFQNKYVTFMGMKVEASNDKGDAFLYKWNGAGQDGDDLYFKVSKDGKTYTFTVESYLCGKDTAVYKAVKNLKVGEVIDLAGFMYWYEGPNPHITWVSTQPANSDK